MPACMLGAATSFDLRQHFVDNGIFRQRLPQGRIQALQQIGDRTFFPSAARVARRMGGISPMVI